MQLGVFAYDFQYISKITKNIQGRIITGFVRSMSINRLGQFQGNIFVFGQIIHQFYLLVSVVFAKSLYHEGFARQVQYLRAKFMPGVCCGTPFSLFLLLDTPGTKFPCGWSILTASHRGAQ